MAGDRSGNLHQQTLIAIVSRQMGKHFDSGLRRAEMWLVRLGKGVARTGNLTFAHPASQQWFTVIVGKFNQGLC